MKRLPSSDGVPIAIIQPVPVPVYIDQDDPNAAPSYGAVQAEALPLVPPSESDIGHPIFRDIPFAILFFIHLAVVVFLGLQYGSFGDFPSSDIHRWNVTELRNLMDDDGVNNNVSNEDWAKFATFLEEAKVWIDIYPIRVFEYIVAPSAIISFAVAYLATAVVIPSCPTAIVTACLLGTAGWALLFFILIIVGSHGSPVGVMIGLIVLGVVAYFLKLVWRSIPFASANLGVALRGISANCGMYLVALLFSFLGAVWVLFWLYVTIGVMEHQSKLHEQEHPKPDPMSHADYQQSMDNPVQSWSMIGLLVSLYWTGNILLNTVQVTIAGVMATWCFDTSEATSCCSPAIFGSLSRSFTYSFGSICMGSLLQAVVAILRKLVENARQQREENNGDGGLLLCILECLIRLLGEILDYFNQWAYVFCGVYGLGYIESGKRVFELFRERGFTAFVTNDLAGFVLGYTNFIVGVVTGIAALGIQYHVDKHESQDDDMSFIFGPLVGPQYWAFGISFLTAVSISSVIMNVVKGAVNTLVVCFADSPKKLEDNHPELTQYLMSAWKSAFPSAWNEIGRPEYSVIV